MGEHRTQARAWARVARAAAACEAARGASSSAANGELFDAIESAVTEVRLDLSDVVDAYAAGAPEVDISEVWDCVEDYLSRIAGVQASAIGTASVRAERALPGWRRQLALRIAAHDLALAAHRTIGGQDEHIETTRRAVAGVLEGARAADASEQQLDAFIGELRVEQCDVVSVITAAACLTHERGRLAQQRGITLPSPPWATTDEIARDRGTPIALVNQLVADALQRGLLREAPGRGVVVTQAGLQLTGQATAP